MFHAVEGDRVAPRELRYLKARDLALRSESEGIDFTSLVECRRSATSETVVLDVGVEVPQRRVHPIRPQERIAATFYEGDRCLPKVEALRVDFPLVPHLNLHVQEHPRSICLYEEQYESLRSRWTSPRFVHAIRRWLALTARGELHHEDQPLEPLLIEHAGHIIFPHDLGQNDAPLERLYVTATTSSAPGDYFLITQREPPSGDAPPFVVSLHGCQPTVHGIINRSPRTLAALADLVADAGLDLLQEIRDRLKKWRYKDLGSHIVCVILFPRTRELRGAVERVDKWAFILDDRLEDVGLKLDVWQRDADQLGIVIKPNLSKRGEDIPVVVLNPSSELTRSMAASLNGGLFAQDPRIAAVGVGALGSQVVMNLARSGFGTWTLIDSDRLMPHNVARHALVRHFVGSRKAEAMASMANNIVADASDFRSLPADVLSPRELGTKLTTAIQEADAVLNMSASVAVARSLACDIDAKARRMSLFLTPTGRDSVLLAEDELRAIRLDAIEMQYYHALVHEESLKGHFTPVDERWRYGQSCRDITSTLPQNLVALHAAIGARAVEKVLDQPGACISIWRSDETGNVRRVDVQPSPIICHKLGAWTVITDGSLLEELWQLRKAKLPTETGGVLFGSFDLARSIVYIVGTVPSPPDSVEWPTLYIRGCKGLQQAVDAVSQTTYGMLEYVGEWHSHPAGVPAAAGADDIQVFTWLTRLMDHEGLPAVMMIAGDPGRMSCFVDEISRQENLLPGVPLYE